MRFKSTDIVFLVCLVWLFFFVFDDNGSHAVQFFLSGSVFGWYVSNRWEEIRHG